MEQQEIAIHGRTVAYRSAGTRGPAAVLIHGMTQDASTWDHVGPLLAEHLRLIAVDLPGHGRSESPQGDHSLGAYASTVRDLLFTLDEPRATVIGHSLGGGVALQFAYQFPEMVDRLVLIDAGGLGPEVSPFLRAASLPGADPVVALLATDRALRAMDSLSRALQRFGLARGADLLEARRGLQKLSDAEARRAFLRTVQATIGLTGQRVSASDKLYLAEHVPTLLIWGARDRIIPLAHATDAHQAIPGSRLRVLRDAGHFPHVDEPVRVAEFIADFVRTTEPGGVPRERWGDVIRRGSGTSRDSA